MIDAKALHVSIGAIRVLYGVNLQVEAGELVAVVGANGAGKTTLLRALSGLLAASSGEVHFAGGRVDGMPAHHRARAGLVHVPQGRQVIPALTVEENLLIGAEQLTVMSRAQRLSGLAAEYERFPVLCERRDVLAGALSGGEQQMLAISRGLMMQPKLLMLDEPSLGLAPRIVEHILNALRTLADQGVAVLLVEQAALGALKIADRGLVLRGGHCVLEGSGEQLLKDPALVKGFLG
ncbi:MAG: ABC transporter ATP-binding protein [Burkholderiaceae bacterium]